MASFVVVVVVVVKGKWVKCTMFCLAWFVFLRLWWNEFIVYLLFVQVYSFALVFKKEMEYVYWDLIKFHCCCCCLSGFIWWWLFYWTERFSSHFCFFFLKEEKDQVYLCKHCIVFFIVIGYFESTTHVFFGDDGFSLSTSFVFFFFQIDY